MFKVPNLPDTNYNTFARLFWLKISTNVHRITGCAVHCHHHHQVFGDTVQIVLGHNESSMGGVLVFLVCSVEMVPAQCQ